MRWAGVAAAAAGLVLAGSAQAAIVTWTVVGTVSPGYAPSYAIDGLGLFGDPGGDLAGLSFTWVTTWDTSLGAIQPDGAATYLYGGSSWGTMPPGSGMFTLNGHTVSLDGDSEAMLQVRPAGTVSEDLYGDLAFGGGLVSTGAIAQFGSVPGQPSSLTQNFHLDCTAVPGKCSGEFFADSATLHTEALLNISSITIASAPEPATWAMMIAGFGLVGLGLRRRGLVAA